MASSWEDNNVLNSTKLIPCSCVPAAWPGALVGTSLLLLLLAASLCSPTYRKKLEWLGFAYPHFGLLPLVLGVVPGTLQVSVFCIFCCKLLFFHTFAVMRERGLPASRVCTSKTMLGFEGWARDKAFPVRSVSYVSSLKYPLNATLIVRH